MKRLIKKLFVAPAVALFVFALVGCSSQTDLILDISNTSGGIAATVNGEAIGERAVSAYVANFREKQGLEEDADLAQWLNDYGYSVEQLRSETISYFAAQLLLRQAAAENDVSVSEEDVDATYQELRDKFDSDEKWKEALETAGVSEKMYRNLLELNCLQNALAEKLFPEVEVDDEDLLSYAVINADKYGLDTEISSLDSIDADTLETIRSAYVADKRYQDFTQWMNDYQDKADIQINDMPSGLAYDIDLSAYQDDESDEDSDEETDGSSESSNDE